MANFLINLISEISGFANFQKCLEICDIVDFNGLLSIDENTLDRMEIFLQKKCSRMPFNERNKFLGDRFVKNPGIFKFSPATRQRIVNVIKNLEKIFTNPLLPISINSISELCNKLSTSNTAAISSIPVNSIEVVLKQNYLVNPFESNVSLSSITSPNDDVSQSDISETKSLGESTKNGTKIDYSNIFQKMDSLRENFSKLSEKPDTNSDEDSQAATKETFPFQTTEIPDNDINKENISRKPAIKRPVDIDSEKDEPSKKIKRVSNRLLNELSSQPEKMLPERLRSQRLINKIKMNKTTELLEIKYGSNETNIPDITAANASGEIQDHGQTSSDNRSTSESNTIVTTKQKESNSQQNKSILSESDKPDLLNNLPQPPNSLEDSENVINKAKQKSKKTPKSRKYSPKISHSADARVSDSVKSSNISKQLSKFKETIINASGAKQPNSLNTGNMISFIGPKETNSTSNQFLHQTYNGLHKPVKTTTNSSLLDKTSKDKQQKFHKSPDSISTDRKLSNTTKYLNRSAEESTVPSEFDVVTHSTVSTLKVTKISERDNTKNSSSHLQVTANSSSKLIGRTWQPPKTSPSYKEVTKSLESHTPVSHPISGQTTSTVSKSPQSQNIQIYIEPDLPKPDLPKPNLTQRVQLSDVPFQCFDSPTLSKKPSCIRIKRPIHSSKPSSSKPSNLSIAKLTPCRFQSDIDAEPSTDNSVINNVNNTTIGKSIDVKPIVTNQVKIQQKANQEMIPIDPVAKESETKPDLTEKSSVACTSKNNEQINVIENSNNHISQPISIAQSAGNGTTKEVSDPEKESSTSHVPFTPEPSWISKPSFITNRFINSTKHIRAVLANGIKAESRLPTESEHPSNA